MRVEAVVEYCLKRAPIVTVEIVVRYGVGKRQHIGHVLERLTRLGQLRKWTPSRGRNRTACYFREWPNYATCTEKTTCGTVPMNSGNVGINGKMRRSRI